MNDETWRDLPGWEELYQVSNCGRVYSKRRERVLSTYTRDSHGRLYHYVKLHRGGVQLTFSVHGLVAATFIGPLPEGMEIDHINNDPADNCVENLEYVTHRENLRCGADRRSYTCDGCGYDYRGRYERDGQMLCADCLEKSQKKAT